MSDADTAPNMADGNEPTAMQAASEEMVFVGMNEKNARELITAYQNVTGRDAAAEHQRQALFLIAFTNRDLGNFNIDKTTGLLNMPKSIAYKWSRGELNEIIKSAQAVRLTNPEETQNWRALPQYNEALQELNIIPGKKPKIEIRNEIPPQEKTVSVEIPVETPVESISVATEPKKHVNGTNGSGLVNGTVQERTAVTAELVDDAIAALSDILTPNAEGQIIFGAPGEPLRVSQTEMLNAVKTALQTDREIALKTGEFIVHAVQPGRTGKTREGIALAYGLHKRKRRTLYVIPSQKALQDFAIEAQRLCPDFNIGAVYAGEKSIGDLTFITYSSLMMRVLGKDVPPEVLEQARIDEEVARASHAEPIPSSRLKIIPSSYDQVIWDEAHMYLTAKAQDLIGKFKHALNIGLTATPRYYEGKEVALVFGKKVYELLLATAKARNEICDYENVLVNTDIKTGLRLSSPDQEESGIVAKALNRTDRNQYFAELYREGEFAITRGEETKIHTLAGRPTIVFCTSIDHVNDMARDWNDLLMPALKNDPVFRQKLVDKGIDPDAVEQIAAPMHSGGSDRFQGLSIDERNSVVDRYHARKVLVMVSTKVLQQSFDSPMTSLVVDSVPRKTFVGTGQAAMRGTGIYPDKDMAILINTEDADHQSLTFTDFELNRGREEGVVVELSSSGNGNGNGSKQQRIEVKNAPKSNYKIISGSALHSLAAQRAIEQAGLYRNDTEFRHFTPEAYMEINRLVREIASGNERAITPFVEIISPWMEKVVLRMSERFFPETRTLLTEEIHDASIDALMKTLQTVRSGNIALWSRFQNRFWGALRYQFEDIQERQNDPNKHMAFSSLPKNQKRYLSVDFDDDVERQNLNNDVWDMLRTLNPKQEKIIKLRQDGVTLEDVAQEFDVGRERIRQIEAKAFRLLRHPARHTPAIREWGGHRPTVKVSRRVQVQMEMQNSMYLILDIKQAFRNTLADRMGRIHEAVYDAVSHDAEIIEGVQALIDTHNLKASAMEPVLTHSARRKIITSIIKMNKPVEEVRRMLNKHRALCKKIENWKTLVTESGFDEDFEPSPAATKRKGPTSSPATLEAMAALKEGQKSENEGLLDLIRKGKAQVITDEAGRFMVQTITPTSSETLSQTTSPSTPADELTAPPPEELPSSEAQVGILPESGPTKIAATPVVHIEATDIAHEAEKPVQEPDAIESEATLLLPPASLEGASDLVDAKQAFDYAADEISDPKSSKFSIVEIKYASDGKDNACAQVRNESSVISTEPVVQQKESIITAHASPIVTKFNDYGALGFETLSDVRNAILTYGRNISHFQKVARELAQELGGSSRKRTYYATGVPRSSDSLLNVEYHFLVDRLKKDAVNAGINYSLMVSPLEAMEELMEKLNAPLGYLGCHVRCAYEPQGKRFQIPLADIEAVYSAFEESFNPREFLKQFAASKDQNSVTVFQDNEIEAQAGQPPILSPGINSVF